MAKTGKIIDIIRSKRTLSFEVFPPKPSEDADLTGIFTTVDALKSTRPDFISVTYSAAGRNRLRAREIAKFIKESGQTPLSHITAVGYTRRDAEEALAFFKDEGVNNFLAIRGDVPQGFVFPQSPWIDFRYARDLIAFIDQDPALCIGAACYPEGHPECGDEAMNIAYLKEKTEAGTDFFITQLFFDNAAFYRFRDRAQAAGVTAPILAGIMPVYKARQIDRILKLSGCSIPPRFGALLERFAEDPEGMEKAGSDFAVSQIRDLVDHGAEGIHLYTMNKSGQAIVIAALAGCLS
jgi:methylenetetrahydrofolate reductase (NADPH)